MVHIRAKPGQTANDVKDEALLEAFEMLGIPKTELQTARNWLIVQQAISEIMQPKVRGRPFPKKPVRVTPVRDAFLLTREYYHPTYPKHLNTNPKKQAYLDRLLEKRQIRPDIYDELSSVLTKRQKDAIVSNTKEDILLRLGE